MPTEARVLSARDLAISFLALGANGKACVYLALAMAEAVPSTKIQEAAWDLLGRDPSEDHFLRRATELASMILNEECGDEENQKGEVT